MKADIAVENSKEATRKYTKIKNRNRQESVKVFQLFSAAHIIC